MVKYGLKLWSTNEGYIPQAKRLYEQRVYDYIELYVLPGSYDRYIKMWQALDIPIIIHCTHFMHGFNLANEEKLQNNLRIFAEVKSFCDELKSKCIIFHPGMKGTLESAIEQTKLMKDERLLVENKPYISMYGDRCRGSSYEELEAIITSCKVGFCLDIPHAINAAFHLKEDIYKYIEKMLRLSPKILHISDGNVKAIHDEHLNIGEGDYDFTKIKKIISLSDADYVTLETRKSNMEFTDFVEDLKKIKEYRLEEVGHDKRFLGRTG